MLNHYIKFNSTFFRLPSPSITIFSNNHFQPHSLSPPLHPLINQTYTRNEVQIKNKAKVILIYTDVFRAG